MAFIYKIYTSHYMYNLYLPLCIIAGWSKPGVTRETKKGGWAYRYPNHGLPIIVIYFCVYGRLS